MPLSNWGDRDRVPAYDQVGPLPRVVACWPNQWVRDGAAAYEDWNRWRVGVVTTLGGIRVFREVLSLQGALSD